MLSSTDVSPQSPARYLLIRLCLALTLVGTAALPGLLGHGTRSASADISGNTYTSPSHGATVTWDNNWFVVEEETNARFDIVRITNGVAFVSVFFEPNDYPTTELVVGLMSGAWRSNPQMSNFVPLSDASGNSIRGGDAGRSFAAFSYTYTWEDGSTRDFAIYMEARSIIDGEVMMSVIADTPIEFFAVETIFAGITLPDASVQLVPEVIAGEAAPVFADGFWRIGVVTAAQGPEIRSAGLSRKDGKEWLVAIVDVTNWSDRAQVLSPRDIRLTLAGVKKPAKIAPSSTASVGKRLELAELTEDGTISIPPGETERIALVYSIAAGGTEPHLTLGQTRLPVADLLGLEVSDETLSARATAPEVQSGRIASASDGRTMRIKLAGSSDSERIRLLGVEPPAKGECMANAAEKLLDRLVDRQVLVEEDAAVTGGSGALRYVWLVNDDGSRTLLNQKLIADGLAEASAIPDDARFGLWLLTSERAAEEDQLGLWAGCASSKATETASEQDGPPTATNSASSTPTGKTTTETSTEWRGEVNQLGTIRFTIDGGMVTAMTVAFSAPCTEPGASHSTSGTPFGLPQPLDDGQFNVTFPFAWDLHGTIHGTVMSDTSVVGTVTVPPLPGCTTEELQFRWSASPA